MIRFAGLEMPEQISRVRRLSVDWITRQAHIFFDTKRTKESPAILKRVQDVENTERRIRNGRTILMLQA